MGVSIRADVNGWGVGKEVDVVLDGAGWWELVWFGENGGIAVENGGGAGDGVI